MILSTTAFFNLRPDESPHTITRSPPLISVVMESWVSAVTLVMELRIDSGNELRIFNASLMERLLRLVSTSFTSMTGIPSTEAPLTEFNIRPLLSTAVMLSLPVLSIAAGFCALMVTSRESGSFFLDCAEVTPGISLIFFSTSLFDTRRIDFPACWPAISNT